jgi:hypothetical protein
MPESRLEMNINPYLSFKGDCEEALAAGLIA